MGYGGKPLDLPHPGDPAVPGALYVRRVRFGYGTTDRSAGGASDGCHVWADTQTAYATSGGIPLVKIAAVSSDLMATASDNAQGFLYGGVIIWEVAAFVKTAFTALVDLGITDSNAADSNDQWAGETCIGSTTVNTEWVASTVYPHAIFNTSDDHYLYLESSGADIAAGILDVFVVYSYADKLSLPNTDWPDTLAG